MLRLIFFLSVLAGLSWGGAWLLEQHGEMEVTWLGYELRTTMAVALGALFTFILVLLFFVQFALFVFGLPEKARRTREIHRMDRAMLALTRGFAAIAAADARGARVASREAGKLLAHHKQGSQLALILSAETEQLEGNHARAEEQFTALLQHKSTEFLGLKGLLIEAQASGDMEKALELAEKAYAARPDGQGIARLLLMLYKRTGAWERASAFLDAYGRRRRISLADQPAEIDIAAERAGILVTRARALEGADAKQALELARKAVRTRPGFLPAAELAARLASALGEKHTARRIIEKQWQAEPSLALGDMYLALSEGAKAKKRIRHALKLLKLSDHPESHRAAARAYLAAGEIPAALNHAKLALAEGETTSLCLLMADIEEEAGDRSEAERWRERGEHALPDAAWECGECRMTEKEWQPVCPACKAVGKAAWRQGEAVSRQIAA